ncbi:MAG: nucleotidyltransferase family protein [Candidatus Aminicenantes bacterium]|nr:nucleotidyltransferase family protein [Candidatus Aminicenantes bacterium]
MKRVSAYASHANIKRQYFFLALFARPVFGQKYLNRLKEEAIKFEAKNPTWDNITSEAEIQGMAPLLYYHFKKTNICPPLSVTKKLQGLFLQHHCSNQVKASVLKDILEALNLAGIPALVLKGGTLCHLLYPEPGLRPMSDLDLLLPDSEIKKAHSILKNLGFSTPRETGLQKKHLHRKHVPPSSLVRNGVTVGVELHHRLFTKNEFSDAGYSSLEKFSIFF